MAQLWLATKPITITEDELDQWADESSKANDPWEDSEIWNKAKSLTSSGEGSTGIFILKTPDSIVVLKSANSIGQEFFSWILGKVLRIKCPLPEELLVFPRMRITGFAEGDEWGIVKEKLAQLAIGSPGLHIKVEKELNRPFFMVQEFVPGQDLPSLGPAKLRIIFTLSENSPTSPLRQLGWIMAFDILINNFDRLPLVWENDGNLANVFFRNDGDQHYQIVGIDQAVTTIDPAVSQKGVENYLKKVEEFIDPLIDSPTMLHTRLLKVQDSLLTWSGFDFNHDQILALQFFILEAVASYGKSLNREALTVIKSWVQKRVVYDWQDIWANMMKPINVEFLDRVLRIFQSRTEKIDNLLSNYPFPYYPQCSCKACVAKRS